MMEKEKEGMERGDRLASSSVSIAKGSVARETSAMGVKRQGPWPEGWDPAAYIGRPEGLSRTRGWGVGGEGVGGWGRAGKKKMGSTANTGSQLKKNIAAATPVTEVTVAPHRRGRWIRHPML